jgi:signal transduction histidine kinase
VSLTSGERVALDYVVRRVANQGAITGLAIESPARLLFETSAEPADLERISQLFSETSQRITMEANGRRLAISFLCPGPSGVASPVVSAWERALRPRGDLFNSGIADKLHDAKNQLVAARAASGRNTTDRTSELEAQLACSRHLDKAAAIARQVQAASSLLTATPTGETVAGDFLRHYTAGLLTRLPSALVVMGPTTEANPLVAVDRNTLEAVLDNLVVNAVEAMQGSGTIQLDCLEDDEHVVFVVQDSGPGLPADVALALASGRTIRSSKALGNGLGLRGVQVLLSHAGGHLELLEVGAGTCWWVLLPRGETADVAEEAE